MLIARSPPKKRCHHLSEEFDCSDDVAPVDELVFAGAEDMLHLSKLRTESENRHAKEACCLMIS